MPEIIGHDKVIARLRQGIPPVSIFLGEKSVGKWTTALWVRDRLAPVDGDIMELRHLDMAGAVEAVKFLHRTPFGKQRLLIAYLGGSPWTTQASLLIALENLPPTSLAILVAPHDVLSPAMLSRGEIFEFNLLSPDEVAQVLMSRNFGEAAARNLAEMSGGRVGTALRLIDANETKISVLGAVKALRLRDAKTLDTFAGRWSDEHTQMLAVLCREAISNRPQVFLTEELELLNRKLALRILTSLRHDVRPRLVIHSQLMTVLKGE